MFPQLSIQEQIDQFSPFLKSIWSLHCVLFASKTKNITPAALDYETVHVGTPKAYVQLIGINVLISKSWSKFH